MIAKFRYPLFPYLQKILQKIIYSAPNKNTFESLEGDRRVLSRVRSGF